MKGLKTLISREKSRRTDLDPALSVKENIIRLDISMDDALAV